MDRIKRARRSPAVLVAVLALVAALAGTAVAGSGPDAGTSASAKKVARKAKKKANKANKKAKKANQNAKSAQSSADSAQTTADNSLQNPVRRVEEISNGTVGSGGEVRDATASCPPGEKAIAGGGAWAEFNGDPSSLGNLTASRPVPRTPGTGPTTGWYAEGKTDSAGIAVRAYALCVPI